MAANLPGPVKKLRGIAQGPVVGELKSAVEPVEQVERLGAEIQPDPFAQIKTA